MFDYNASKGVEKVMSDIWILRENKNLILTPVIASFDTEGKIRPLYFSFEGLRLKIDNIKCIKKLTDSQIEFACEITLIDRVKTAYFVYHTNYRAWSIDKRRWNLGG